MNISTVIIWIMTLYSPELLTNFSDDPAISIIRVNLEAAVSPETLVRFGRMSDVVTQKTTV